VTLTFRLLLIWLFAGAIAFAVQLNWMSATASPEGFVPVGNDAFYHARRIIDTARDPAGFYEVDHFIHAPEGSLLTWPWGYDYGMGMLLKAGTDLGLAGDPMKFLAYVPPFAVLITIALAIAIATGLGLSLWSVLLLALCVALSPLTQGMHSIGSIDHHYAEYMIILAFMASALWWMRRPESRPMAAVTALVLGTGPAVHNGLFALQVPLLLATVVCWLRSERLPSPTIAVFGLTLIFATLAVLVPSLPFRLGMSEFYLLSWFHLYVASCTALAMGYLARCPRTARSILGLVAIAVLLTVPLLRDFLLAGAFVGKEADALEVILEARSVWSFYLERGFLGVSAIYSSLIFLVPLLWLGCAYAITRTTDRRHVLLCVYALLTLPLMLAQFRFQYYGSLALYLPLLVLAEQASTTKASRRRAAMVVVTAVLCIAYYPAVRHGLGERPPLGNDLYYQLTRRAMPALAAACEDDPGIVLARSNDGHPIRYHTDCSVIANNFLLTDQHFEAVRRVDDLFMLTPQQLLESGFPVKYVLVRARGVVMIRTDGSVGLVPFGEAPRVSDPLTDALLWGDQNKVPGQFKLLHEIEVPGGAYQYARIWKIEGDSTQVPASMDRRRRGTSPARAPSL
jgi:hypothetical protein